MAAEAAAANIVSPQEDNQTIIIDHRVIQTSNPQRYSPRPSARSPLPLALSPGGTMKGRPLTLETAQGTPKEGSPRAAALSPAGATRNTSLKHKGPPPASSLSPRGSSATTPRKGITTEEDHQAAGDVADATVSAPTNFRSLSVKIEKPQSGAGAKELLATTPSEGRRKSAITPLSSRTTILLSPRSAAVTPVNADDEVAPQVFTPKREYVAGKAKSSAMPNLQGLDDKTARLLLEERQRINNEFTKLRKENQELMGKLNRNGRKLDTVHPATEASSAALKQELEALKEKHKEHESREAQLKKEVEKMRSTAGKGNPLALENLKHELEVTKRKHDEEVDILLKVCREAQSIMAQERERRAIEEAEASTLKFAADLINQANRGNQALGVPKLLWKGGHLWKFPYNNNGQPKKKWVQIKSLTGKNGQAFVSLPVTLMWFDPDKKDGHEVELEEVESITNGHDTMAFWKQVVARGRNSLPDPDLCFSLVCDDRTLDFASETAEEARAWQDALKYVLDQLWAEKGGHALPGQPIDAPEKGASNETVRKIKEAQTKQLFGMVRLGRAKDIKRLITQGELPIDTPDPASGDTALILACQLGLAEVVEVCLELGAKNDPHPTFGQTALQAAVSAGHANCVEQILEDASLTEQDYLIANHEDPNGEAPIHVASRCGNEDIIKVLINHGANVEAIDVRGGTCLHTAASSGSKKCLAYILDSGGDHLIDDVDIGGNTPLHLAAKTGKLECIRLLLETAANPRPLNKGKQTPYQIAISKGHQQIARLLYEYEKDAPDAAPPPPLTARRGSASGGMTARGERPSFDLPRPNNGLCEYSVPLSARLEPYQATSVSQQTIKNGVPTLNLSGIGSSCSSVHNPTLSARQKTARIETSAPSTGLFKGLDLYASLPASYSDMPTQRNLYQGPSGAWGSTASTHGMAATQPLAYQHQMQQQQQQQAMMMGQGQQQQLLQRRGSAASLMYQQQQQQQHPAYTRRGSGSIDEMVLPDRGMRQTQQQQQGMYGDPLMMSMALGSRRNSASSQADAVMIAPGSNRGEGGMGRSQYHQYQRRGSGGAGGHTRPGSARLSLSGYQEQSLSNSYEAASPVPYRTNADPYAQQQQQYQAAQYQGRGQGAQYFKQGSSDSLSGYRPRSVNVGMHLRAESVHYDIANRQYDDDDDDEDDDDYLTDEDEEGDEGLSSSPEPHHHHHQHQQQEAYQDWGGQEGQYDHYYEYQAEMDLYIGEEHWRVQYTEENYPYYLQVNTGHTQWEDPSQSTAQEEATSSGNAAEEKAGGIEDAKSPTAAARSPNLARSPKAQSPPRSPAMRSPYPEIQRQSGSLMAKLKATSRLACTSSQEDVSSSPSSTQQAGGENVSRSGGVLSPTGGYRESKLSQPQESSPVGSNIMANQQDASGPTPVVSESKSPTAVRGLSAKEMDALQEVTLAPFLKMLKMGVPLPSIKHKMAIERIDPSMMEAFDEIATQKMGDEESKAVAAPKETVPLAEEKKLTSPATDAESMKQDPNFAKYFKMISVGVPKPSVYAKISGEGMSPVSLTRFKQACGDAPTAASTTPSPAAPTVDKEAMKADPKFAKYFGMISVGVPAVSVYGKMASEGVPADDINLFKLANGENVPIPREGGDAGEAKRRRDTAMLKVHWDAISADKVSENSVWSTTPRNNDLEASEIQELESLFAAKPTAKSTPTGGSAKSDRKEITLLDPKRAYNVSIGLAQFKPFNGYENLFRAVIELDASNLNLEKLDNLTGILPTSSELQILKQYEGPAADLAPAEHFFHTVLRYPRLEPKVKAFIFKLQFRDLVDGVRTTMNKVAVASKQIRTSEGLALVLQRLLVVGNVMNEGTHRGKAAGFSLESLLKITQTKGVDKKTTVLDYVVRSAFEKKEDTLLDFPNELTQVAEAERLPAREVEKEIAKVKVHLEEMLVTLRMENENLEAAQKVASSGQEADRSTGARRGYMGDITIDSLTMFTKGLEVFYYDALEGYQGLSAEGKAMTAEIRSLAEYFLEDPNVCESQTLFNTVLTFVKIFNQSKEMQKRMRKVQERQHLRSASRTPEPSAAATGSFSATSEGRVISPPTTPSRRAEERNPLRRDLESERLSRKLPATPLAADAKESKEHHK